MNWGSLFAAKPSFVYLNNDSSLIKFLEYVSFRFINCPGARARRIGALNMGVSRKEICG